MSTSKRTTASIANSITNSTKPDFEPLRDMEAFTRDMFNRIIAFQEKEHHAWNHNLSFDARIKGLPLHNLIFSNPDRNPATHSATVAAYFPLREELQKIAFYVRQLADDPVVCDLYPGNGFIGSLLGREIAAARSANSDTGKGTEVIGLQHPSAGVKPNQIESFYDAEHFAYRPGSFAALHHERPFDAALISWPPANSNPSPELVLGKTRLLIYVFTRHLDEQSQQPQTGSEAMLSALADDYRLIDSWEVLRPKDLLHDIWPDMTPSIAETRHVHIYAHRTLEDLQPAQGLAPVQSYDWEKDLQMALLALQAKQTLQGRGFPA
ncbi:MAG: hypothetical protein RRB22_14055 [Gammaproteobacteria bacterium]|nr:hypothetical protein [Gammaproteobacteria bacterium]